MDVDRSFCVALPKVELHAHLTGSISARCLHEIWVRKKSDLQDPASALRPEGAYHDILTFFKLFDTYIYNLCNDVESIAFATDEVLRDFREDGVKYLELRTTPREARSTGLTKEVYLETVLATMEKQERDIMPTYLILSIDRRNTLEQAMDVVKLAIKYRERGVVGIDLCGNPLNGDVAVFREAFELAKLHGLKITLHFAEVPDSSTDAELRTLLSYQPDRIGHVIHVPSEFAAEIERRSIGLELCISCNVHAKMLPAQGGYSDHHFGKWRRTKNPLALCTDDVGVFGSPVSNEYLLAAQHFDLSGGELVELSRSAIPSIFGDEHEKMRMMQLLDAFGRRY